jgi:predicted DNA-binding transcriptional regulator YafY
MPPLLLDDDEAVAIAVGLRASAGQAVIGVEEASVRALAKLEQVLPARLRYRVRALQSATVSLAWQEPSVDPEVLTVLAAAIANHERVRFAYRAGSRRVVEPHRLVAAGRRWYLVAYDTARDDWRIFRVDRIRDPQPLGIPIAPRELPEQDAATYVTSKFSELAPIYRAVATLHLPLEEAARRLGGPAGELEAIDAHTCRLQSATDTLGWLAVRLLLLDCEFEVHEPPELAEYLQALGARATRAVGAVRTDA